MQNQEYLQGTAYHARCLALRGFTQKYYADAIFFADFTRIEIKGAKGAVHMTQTPLFRFDSFVADKSSGNNFNLIYL